MFDHAIRKVHQQKVFSGEDMATEQHGGAAFLYYAGLSYLRIEAVVKRFYDSIQQWFHRL